MSTDYYCSEEECQWEWTSTLRAGYSTPDFEACPRCDNGHVRVYGKAFVSPLCEARRERAALASTLDAVRAAIRDNYAGDKPDEWVLLAPIEAALASSVTVHSHGDTAIDSLRASALKHDRALAEKAVIEAYRFRGNPSQVEHATLCVLATLGLAETGGPS